MNKLILKKVFYFVLLFSVVLLLTSCAGTVSPPTPPTTPTTYTIKVISGCGDCFGNVVINGIPSGSYLIPWGAANISGVPAGAAIRLEDEFGWVSHTEFFYPPYTNIIFSQFF
jgi:hypothetical protein